MELLMYNDLKMDKVKAQFDKVTAHLQEGNFRAADVKKMSSGYYRAKLDDTNRLLFKIGTIENKKYILLLEVILNHDYENSRFLRGYGIVDETKLVPMFDTQHIEDEDCTPLVFVNEKSKKFNFLDKIISFDLVQTEVENLPLPIIIIGSAGSGKTALTLEKMKHLHGRILFVTLSSFLVENAKNVYYAMNYENKNQETDFLSFFELLCSAQVPDGQEMDFRKFEQWIWRHKESHKIKDTYKLYEEFKGVLTGSSLEQPYLDNETYINLGVRQSIIAEEERQNMYDLFVKYLEYIKTNKFYDTNILSYEYLSKVVPIYDYIVMDEVQDLTSIQMKFIFSWLKDKGGFMLCGDSNQIVHPNFFSWSKVKTLFYGQDLDTEVIRVLGSNYRNTFEVTQLANKLLLAKNARFGSIDKESTYLVNANVQNKGEIVFYENQTQIKSDFNRKTKNSTKFAIIVLRNEDKPKARQFFDTPLLFSVHEAKGLEYENVILYDLISSHDKEFREITQGVSKEDLVGDEIRYARARDKSDKSLDEYKFYINALYVAMTRAVKNLFFIESHKKHDLLELLSITQYSQNVHLQDYVSSSEEWMEEARRLELQGKLEQAEEIRSTLLHESQVPWEILDREKLPLLIHDALNPVHFNKKSKDTLFSYALFYEEISLFEKLTQLKYKPAEEWQVKGKEILLKQYLEYVHDNVKMLKQKTDVYGVNFRYKANLTPLMLAAKFNAINIFEYLISQKAKTSLTDNYGRTAMHILMINKYQEKGDASLLFEKYYPILKKDSLKVKIDQKLVKIEHFQGEFLVLNYMIAILRDLILYKDSKVNGHIWDGPPAFDTKEILDFCKLLPSEVIPLNRKSRSYISNMLTKNEANSQDKNSKKLFTRIDHGFYILNPMMSVYLDEAWVNVYDAIHLQELKDYLLQSPVMQEFAERVILQRKWLTENPDNFDHQAFWDGDIITQ